MSFFVPISLYDNFGFECKKLIEKTLYHSFAFAYNSYIWFLLFR